MHFNTACVHGARGGGNPTGALCTPIFQSATFAHPGLGQSTGYDYSRMQNPTREQLENTLAQLEGSADALAFSSGMAAIACLMELFSPGDHVLASDDLYGGTIRLFEHVSRKNGVAVDYVDTGDLALLEATLTPQTRMVFVETPTNPMMHVTDVAAVKRLLAGRDILLALDNTFLTPYFFRPIEHGADVVTHSGTKYLGGHNDTLAGFLAPATAELAERLRFIFKTTGGCLAPFDSFLIERGMKTLALRMEEAQKNAVRLARWLLGHKKVTRVYYPGLEDHPGYAVSRRQGSGFGAMLSFEVDSPKTARQVLSRVQLILFAESLGGVDTLITYPLLQTHADVPPEKLAAGGISDRLLRVSVGIENVQDLIADLEQALL